MAETSSGPEQGVPAPVLTLPDVVSMGVGNALRTRREDLGWALPHVAAWLRIRESYLEAFEAGQGDIFPAQAYALGFLKTYAEALGFDGALVVSRYKQEGKAAVRKPELTFPAPPPDRRIPPALTVSLGLAVIVGAYAGWYHFMGHAPPVPEHVPPVADIIPGEKTANAPSPQVASLLPAPGTSPPPLPPLPQPSVVPPSSQTVHTENAAGATPLVGGGGSEKVTANVEPSTPPQGADAASTALPESMQAQLLVVKAVAASWVQVKAADGKVVYDHIMQAGDTWAVPEQDGPYTLTVGNAGGIVVSLGNATTAQLGRNGSVRRKIPLTAEAFRNGSLAGAAVAVNVPVPATEAAPLVEPPAVPVPAVQPKPRKPAEPAAPEITTDDLNDRELQSIKRH